MRRLIAIQIIQHSLDTVRTLPTKSSTLLAHLHEKIVFQEVLGGRKNTLLQPLSVCLVKIRVLPLKEI